MTTIANYGRKPTSALAAAFEWHAAPEANGLRDAGWCLAAMIWGAVLLRLALVLL